MQLSASPTVEEIKALRRYIDHAINETVRSIKASQGQYGSRELAIVRTKLQEAKMWCGKVLEEFGHELPEEFQDKS